MSFVPKALGFRVYTYLNSTSLNPKPILSCPILGYGYSTRIKQGLRVSAVQGLVSVAPFTLGCWVWVDLRATPSDSGYCWKSDCFVGFRVSSSISRFKFATFRVLMIYSSSIL